MLQYWNFSTGQKTAEETRRPIMVQSQESFMFTVGKLGE